MRSIVLTFFSLLILVPFSATQAEETVTPKLYGVLFYADWCSSCAILEPSVEEAKTIGNFSPEDIQFIKFDLSNAETNKEAISVADTYGLSNLLGSNLGRTGYMAIVSSDEVDVLSRITKKYGAEEIVEMINAELEI